MRTRIIMGAYGAVLSWVCWWGHTHTWFSTAAEQSLQSQWIVFVATAVLMAAVFQMHTEPPGLKRAQLASRISQLLGPAIISGLLWSDDPTGSPLVQVTMFGVQMVSGGVAGTVLHVLVNCEWVKPSVMLEVEWHDG